ncbi:hypothetical protein [Marivivens marinus]|uniref:hypothetical protein n=1 Tax=Marivivens marinus TaxID=3110173 RepID=UPI003B8471DD
MSKKELEAYRFWFEVSIPPRLNQLRSLVRLSRGFGDWPTDFSLSSLDRLSEWGSDVLKSVPKGSESPTDLSILFDIGIYMGECLVSSSPLIVWEQNIRAPRNDVDFGAMVINGPSDLKFDLYQIVYVASLKLRNGRLDRDWLRRTFDLQRSFLIDGWDGLPLRKS